MRIDVSYSVNEVAVILMSMSAAVSRIYKQISFHTAFFNYTIPIDDGQ